MENMEIHPSPEQELTPATPVAVSEAPPADDRLTQVQRLATEAYNRYNNDWIMFFREVLGSEGIIRRMFPTAEELANFEKTPEHDAIQQMLTKLREMGDDVGDGREPTRVITVRLPKSVHESLKSEAHLHRTSMNQLCISKLLQLIDTDFVPNG